MATHSSILAWKNTMGRKAWPVAVLGVAKSWTQLSTHMHAVYVAGSPWPLGELIIRVTEIQRSEFPNKSLIDRLPMRFSSPSRRVLFFFNSQETTLIVYSRSTWDRITYRVKCIFTCSKICKQRFLSSFLIESTQRQARSLTNSADSLPLWRKSLTFKYNLWRSCFLRLCLMKKRQLQRERKTSLEPPILSVGPSPLNACSPNTEGRC